MLLSPPWAAQNQAQSSDWAFLLEVRGEVVKRVWIVAVALVLLGCLSIPLHKEPEELELPPMPEEVYMLWQMYGKPEIYPGVVTTLVWDFGAEKLHLTLAYDQFVGWIIAGYKITGESRVPSEFALFMYQAQKARRNREVPRDPWGNPITDPDVLHPERRGVEYW